MFSISAQKSRQVVLPQTAQHQQPQQLQAKTQLTKDTVEIKQKTKQQVAEETQHILAQAKTASSPELQLLGINKALKSLQAEVAKEKDQALKAKQENALAQMLKENAEIRKQLDEPTLADKPDYPRHVTQVEEKLMDRLFQDLAHPDKELAEKAHARLKKLGVPDELLNKITEQLKSAKPASKKVLFAGKEGAADISCRMPDGEKSSYEELIRGARKHIYFGNTAEQVTQVGVEHELETVQHLVKPILFGGGGYYVIGYDHNGYPIMEYSHNAT